MSLINPREIVEGESHLMGAPMLISPVSHERESVTPFYSARINCVRGEHEKKCVGQVTDLVRTLETDR